MNQDKTIDSCIEYLKAMLRDQLNELESEQRRALTKELRKLKRLKLKPHLNRDEVRRVVSEVAATVAEIM
jgi:hypothetical protein